MESGLVSVMMPAYNAERYIAEAVASLLGQSYPHWELVVINDGSTDDTVDVLAQYSDSRIKVYHQNNSGEAAARNAAIKYMRGEFVAFLDADDVYLPQHLEVLTAYLQDHPAYDGVYSDGFYINQHGDRSKSLASRRRGPFTGHIFEEVVYASDVFGPPLCVVLRFDVIARHHLQYDETIIIGPDWDFFMKYAAVAQFGYVDQPTCLYRVHQTNITTQISLKRRALEFAKCRVNAVKMNNFQACSVDTRLWVFYDLLVNLLRGDPVKQAEIVDWPEFRNLPPAQQAKLLRIMAGRALIDESQQTLITAWLQRSRKLNPYDFRSALLYWVFRISPAFSRMLLHFKIKREWDPTNTPPFADLGQG